MQSMRSRTFRILALAVGAALALGACGGSSNAASSSTTSPTTPTSAGATGARNAAFTTCLAQHGVTLPSGGFGQPGGGQGTGTGTPGSRPALSAKQQSALGACRSKLPNGGGGGGRFPGGGANPQALQAYLSCLGVLGVTVPTSTSGSTAGGRGSALGAVRNDPKFTSANKTCAPLLPTSGSTTTTTPN
jgi:hypothetical protein